MGTYEGRRVTTEWGDGTIRTLTGCSVVIDVDPNPETPHATIISIVRGTHGWDRFVAANASLTN